MMTREGRCPNFNHGRPNAPVRFCSMCGEVVNNKIPAKISNETKVFFPRRTHLSRGYRGYRGGK